PACQQLQKFAFTSSVKDLPAAYHLTSPFTVLQVMASNMLPEKQFYCPVCVQVFTDPVTTPCGHNFCQTCIKSNDKFWERKDITR
uniref:RING-type domain-containing protein n=1 Tax=Amphilophus citrinellus TaxID=61819 RepID=A0A3Q0T104_AMPCI